MTTTLDVLDQGTPISFTVDDLLKYHGPGFVGGVAHGFKALERALPLLADGGLPERREIRVETAFPGPGARDAMELVIRAVTGDRYLVDTELGDEAVVASAVGRYFFRFICGSITVELRLRPGMVAEEFLELGRRGASTPEERARLEWLKQDMADRLHSHPAADVYDAEVV